MRPSEWLLVELSTIKSQSNTLTVQPRRKGAPGNQMIIPFSIVENMAKRRQYTKEEDKRILDFVCGEKERISGNQLWCYKCLILMQCSLSSLFWKQETKVCICLLTNSLKFC